MSFETRLGQALSEKDALVKKVVKVEHALLDERLAQATSNQDLIEAKNWQVKKEERLNVAKEEVKWEALSDIIKFGIGFKCSTFYLIKMRHPRLDLYRVDFTTLQGHDIIDPDDDVEVEVKASL